MNIWDHDLKHVPHSAAITKSQTFTLMYRAVFPFPDKTQFDRSKTRSELKRTKNKRNHPSEGNV